jgi:hypothetical protein
MSRRGAESVEEEGMVFSASCAALRELFKEIERMAATG